MPRRRGSRLPPRTVVPLMEEADLAPVQIRRRVIAGRILSSVLSLPSDDPLRMVAELDPLRRLAATTGWRWLGAQALRLSDVRDIPVQEHVRI